MKLFERGWLKIGMIAMVLCLMATILIPSPVKAATYYYDREDAVAYALQWWDEANPNYEDFGENDCTNFISQCMLAGGWPETGKYSYQSLYAWYYDWGWQPGFSNTWTVANDFRQFLSIYSSRGSAYSLAHTPWDEYFQIGDLVQIDYDKNGSWDHSMIITSVTDDDMYVTYHWADDDYVSLSGLIDDYPNAWFMGYRLADQFSE